MECKTKPEMTQPVAQAQTRQIHLPPLKITPPLLNSANPWATTLEDLQALYNCPHTGAVTIRTSLVTEAGFPHDPTIHQYAFHDISTHTSTAAYRDVRNDILDNRTGPHQLPPDEGRSSLNTLGYSPIPLKGYLSVINAVAIGYVKDFKTRSEKPFIVSVTGTAEEVAEAYVMIHTVQSRHPNLTLHMEVNLSCPNIPGHPPPAYNEAALTTYLHALYLARETVAEVDDVKVQVGLKTPPYTYAAQFEGLIKALKSQAGKPAGSPVHFITACNTLGSCLLLLRDGGQVVNSASGEGIGGLAGAALHPLALGNVFTIRKMLDACAEDADEGVSRLKDVVVIGTGGVSDADGWKRMRDVGAGAVGVGTALGSRGVCVFEEIAKGFEREA